MPKRKFISPMELALDTLLIDLNIQWRLSSEPLKKNPASESDKDTGAHSL